MKPVDQLMRQAVSDGIFPGGVLLVAKHDAVVFRAAYGYGNIFSKTPMTVDTVFDLASLTKPLATTLAIMTLVSRRKIGLKQRLGDILDPFDESEKADIRIEHLLYHSSGLPDYRPYYKRLDRLPHSQRKDALRTFLLQEPLVNPVGQMTLYSDLGFMILCWVIEKVTGLRLDRFVKAQIYDPLHLSCLFFIDHHSPPLQYKFAATEQCPWRKALLSGVVHDDNAYAVGGIEGHAGLFGNVDDIHRLLTTLLAAAKGRSNDSVFQKNMLQLFFKRHGRSKRALGFDMPAASGASCGRYFSQTSVGHLGFTGTSFWMDLERDIIVILLTNRIHPRRDNDEIKYFRPLLHDAVMQNIALDNPAGDWRRG